MQRFCVLLLCRKLGTAGQKMGGSAALCHIRHDLMAPGEHGGCFTLKAANVGKCQAVLCRDGKAMQLSSVHTVKQEPEYQRVRRHNAIVTEVTRSDFWIVSMIEGNPDSGQGGSGSGTTALENLEFKTAK